MHLEKVYDRMPREEPWFLSVNYIMIRSGTVRLQGVEVGKVHEFKCSGSTVQSNRDCGKEVKGCRQG